ncbi:hypothetical protein RRG08_002440 [Elysia crispata]|uniref:Uncharacterized protein n=1 Tax=Elysia crispata TaxID=231223 RepID=A0AAE1DTX1_9GAST|nr:hypothetical protein RRG08_002440 [Elysia crispata]
MTGTMLCRSGSVRWLGQCHADLGACDEWDNVMQIWERALTGTVSCDEWDNVMQIWERAMTGTMSCRSGSGRPCQQSEKREKNLFCLR